MASTTLDQVRELVDQLSPIEQAKLLEYLMPRITRAIAQQQAATSAADVQHQNAWAELSPWRHNRGKRHK